jgi:acyl-CoA thioesterase FadM
MDSCHLSIMSLMLLASAIAMHVSSFTPSNHWLRTPNTVYHPPLSYYASSRISLSPQPLQYPCRVTSAILCLGRTATGTLDGRGSSTSTGPSSAEAKEDHVFDVYIESTDAYGMVFYPNYIVEIERSYIKRHDTPMRILSMKNMKYRKPGRLGDRLCIRRTVSKRSGQESIDIVRIAKNSSDEVIFTASGITAVALSDKSSKSSLIQSSELSGMNQFSFEHSVWPDERDVNGMLLTKTIFTLFERGRTDILGGPAALAATAVDDVHVYVNRISDFLVNQKSLLSSEALFKVKVVTNVDVVADIMIEFKQSIYQGDESQPVASATITTVCVKDDAPVAIPLSIKDRVTAR